MTAVVACGLAAGLNCTLDASAQSEESELPPAPGEFEAAPLPPPAQPFFVPDVPQSVVEQTQVRERWFTLKLGVAAILDYTAFNQDSASISQVGRQDNEWQVRDLRLGPKALKGHEGNWIQTMPGKSFNCLLRLYGPLQPWFDKTWKPGDFERVK